jgi:hypothetical protein
LSPRWASSAAVSIAASHSGSPVSSPCRIALIPWVMEKPAPATKVNSAARNAQT